MSNINEILVTKYLLGEANPDEAVFIDGWINESEENKKFFREMQEAYLTSYGLPFVNVNESKAWSAISGKLIEKKEVSYRWIYSSAAALIILVCAFFLMRPSTSSNVIITGDDSVTQSLKDNSIIILESKSKIVLNEKFGKENRRLSLEGQAKFTVNHDESMPFIVESGGVFIEDLGTVFEVKCNPTSDTVYVVVNEGIVKLYDLHGNEITIKAGEKAWYIRSQKKIITDINTKVVKFDFTDTRLLDAVALLEESYDIKIDLIPASIGECKITTQFFDEDIPTIITVITETLGFQYHYQDHQYKIEGKPCK